MKPMLLVLAALLVFACSSGDVEPTTTSSFGASVTANYPACDGTRGLVGEPLRLVLRAETTSTWCMCSATTRDNGWSCSDRLHCQSSYDLGGPNETRCTTSRAQTHAIRRVVSSADGCSIDTEAGEDAGTTDMLVRCSVPGPVAVAIHLFTEKGELDADRTLTFVRDGECPAVQDAGTPDGDGTDAGTASEE